MRVAGSMCALVALVAAASLIANAQSSRSGDVSITAVGKKHWELACSLKLADGKDFTGGVSGKSGDVRHFDKRDVAAGTCTLTLTAGGSLNLQFDTKDFACPFPNAEQKSCKRYVKDEESVQLTLNLRP